MEKTILNFSFLISLLLFLTVFSQAQTMNVKVAGIVDSNTITVITMPKAQIHVQIKGIDTPEAPGRGSSHSGSSGGRKR
jgi:endonuclease YncB( thermonuclease family)